MLSPPRIPFNELHLRPLPPKPNLPSFVAQYHSSVYPINVSFKTLSSSSSTKLYISVTEQSFEFEDQPVTSNSASSTSGSSLLTSLPVVIKRGGKVSRYFWDGSHLELLGIDGGRISWLCSDFDDARDLWGSGVSFLRDLFIPKQVRKNYIDYVKWKFLHRVFSSAIQVLATQAMFRAIGVGHAKSLPSAAALNWALKDGLGRLSRCIYTACVGSAFDTNLKRIRLATSVLFSLGIAVELLTPIFPHCFLLLASVANIAKQISLSCHLATCSAVHQSFAIADNLGEVSAKAQIQTVCFDNLGLLLAALLNFICRNDQRLQVALPFLVYPVFSAMDLFGIHQAFKHVHLQTLTKERLEIILNTWIRSRYVPSPAEVSEKEDINLLKIAGKESWPIRIGSVEVKNLLPVLTLQTMRSLSSEDFYFVNLESRNRKERRIVLCLREGVTKMDIIRGLLQACYVRKCICQSRTLLDYDLEGEGEADVLTNSIEAEWSRLMKDGGVFAGRELDLLYEQMKQMGWVVGHILLSDREQARYTFVEEKDV